jgi:lipopolysaccharide biosynthesis glycosyltransferase
MAQPKSGEGRRGPETMVRERKKRRYRSGRLGATLNFIFFMEPVTVVFSSNDSHALLLGVALCSLFENKKGDYPVRVFVLDGGISEKNKKRLSILEDRYSFRITYMVPDSRLFAEIANSRPIAAYYRIAIGYLLPPDCHKAIYLDCDVIVRGDIAELFGISLEGKTVGAVPDQPQSERRAHLEKMCEDLSLVTVPHNAVYFNSGVLMIDVDRWRTRDVERKLFAFIREHPDKLCFDDQDPLNVIFIDDRKTLPAKFNFVPVGPAIKDDPVVIHFAGGIKPWYFLSALPYQREYLHYVNLTPWKYRKYRKPVDTFFAKKYHFYPVAWWAWCTYKKIRCMMRRSGGEA